MRPYYTLIPVYYPNLAFSCIITIIRVKTVYKKGNRPPIKWKYLKIGVLKDYQRICTHIMALTTLIPMFKRSLKLKFSLRLSVSHGGSQNFFRPYNSNKALFLLIGDH